MLIIPFLFKHPSFLASSFLFISRHIKVLLYHFIAISSLNKRHPFFFLSSTNLLGKPSLISLRYLSTRILRCTFTNHFFITLTNIGGAFKSLPYVITLLKLHPLYLSSPFLPYFINLVHKPSNFLPPVVGLLNYRLDLSLVTNHYFFSMNLVHKPSNSLHLSMVTFYSFFSINFVHKP